MYGWQSFKKEGLDKKSPNPKKFAAKPLNINTKKKRMIKMVERRKVRLNDGRIVELRKQDAIEVKKIAERNKKRNTLVGKIKWILNLE